MNNNANNKQYWMGRNITANAITGTGSGLITRYGTWEVGIAASSTDMNKIYFHKNQHLK
jgi:hypothetical protein